jgi:molybdenum cofactor guanylyltransferase
VEGHGPVTVRGDDPPSPPRLSGQPYDALVLAGGAGRRLAGADKPSLVVGGQRLLDRVLAAVAGAERTIVVGPPRHGVATVSEEPPGAGPVPALRRGLAEVSAPWVAVLAADLPFLRAGHIGVLLRAAGNRNGAVLADDGGRPQWLAGCWRTAAVRAALASYPGDSVRGLLGPLQPVLLRLPDEPWRDCDTPADLAWARERYNATEI